MIIIKQAEKNDYSNTKFKRIYQYKNGSFLPDSSQPDPEIDYEITSKRYTPHKSTRYMNVVIGGNRKAQSINQSGNLLDIDKDLPELYSDRKNCCGCTACYAICPVQAITMRPDEEGFMYPVVDAEKCLRCYKCLTVCVLKERHRHN